jgi:hypothetical protein
MSDRVLAIRRGFVSLMLCLMFMSPTHTQASGDHFTVVRVYRHVFVERPVPGVRNVYRGYAADIDAKGGATRDAMFTFAQQLYERMLRHLTEQEGGDLVWITFKFESGRVIDGRISNDTFRVIYNKRGGTWQRLPAA